MKKHFFLFLFIFGFIYSCFAANDSISSKIIIYRENNFYASANAYKIFANDSMIVKLRNNSYFAFDCKPGEYKVIVDKIENTSMKINVLGGRTYYLRLSINRGFWSPIQELIWVDSSMAVSRILTRNLQLQAKGQLSLFRPHNRIGINLSTGLGFNSFPMFLTTDSAYSKISFAGGYGIGIKYGCEISKHFDLAIDINYQFSILMPYLSNATTVFRRGSISITPSYIIPIGDGETKRLKIGGGYDFYCLPQLSVGGYKIQKGFNETWNYNLASGFHASVNFEMNFSTKWSLNYGLKYYYVKYTYLSGGINRWPKEGDALYNTNGSGIDLLLGLYYHF
ncbi:MAG: DUF2846 domain-containing protein [Bacteroidota bacterium]